METLLWEGFQIKKSNLLLLLENIWFIKLLPIHRDLKFSYSIYPKIIQLIYCLLVINYLFIPFLGPAGIIFFGGCNGQKFEYFSRLIQFWADRWKVGLK